jgi:hypothetical protein
MQIVKGKEFFFSSEGDSQFAVEDVPVGVTTLQAATAVIEGLDVQFANRDDHNLGRLLVRLDTDIVGGGGNVVRVTAQFALRDWSGGDNDTNGDDAIQGTIRYSIIAV